MFNFFPRQIERFYLTFGKRISLSLSLSLSLSVFLCDQIATMNSPCNSNHGMINHTKYDVASIQEPNVVTIRGCY